MMADILKWITKVLFIILLGRNQEDLQGQNVVSMNQFGYRPEDKKIAFVRGLEGKSFQVIDTRTTKSIYRGKIVPIGTRDRNTGETLFTMDFSQVRAPGSYQVWLPEASIFSSEFQISEDVFSPVTLRCLEGFYYQRCGTEVDNGTIWSHPACHLRDAVFFNNPSKSKNVTGGWHDAGDYGKFIATGAVSAAFILYLYEHDPKKFADGQLHITESSNGVPDILDEARWELEWLLTMQREDGAVYHKVSIKKWNGEFLPHVETDPRYIFDVSTTATGSFAATTALGSRIFKNIDKEFSRKLLKSAMNAWNFLEAHHSMLPEGGFRNPDGVEGGEYGDTRDLDERLWASVELYRTTENLPYHRYFLTNYQALGGVNYTLGWQHVQNFAYYSYMKIHSSAANYQARSYIVSTLTHYCDVLLGRIKENGYRIALKEDEYYWGSNSVVLGYAFDLIQAHEITKQPRYLDGALDQLHYVLGRNAFNISFITGVGSNSVRRPYHQFSMMLGAGKPVPGLAVGGPNKYGKLRGKVLSEFPGKCYEDNEKNYYVNEVAINYTAPLVFVAGYCSKLNSMKSTSSGTMNTR